MRYFVILLVIAAIVASVAGQTKMLNRVHQDGFAIIGIEARTSNAQEMRGEGVIPKQWQEWQKRALAHSKQPEIHGADANLYALYTDYASDRNGEYSFVIGVKAEKDATVPQGMVLKKIPSGNYAMVTSHKGPVGKVVTEAWQQVWALEDKAQLGSPRAYRADFEVYDRRSADPQDSQVDLYVGLQ